METLRTFNTCHILDPYTFSFRVGFTLTTANGNKLVLFFSHRFTLAEFQLVKSITMTFKQLRLFDGEITVTGKPARIIFIVEKKRLVVVKLSAILHAPNSLAELFMARSISYA